MAKGLASKLKTGALISAGLIALAGTPKADAALIYDSGLQTVTNHVATGDLVIRYSQLIEEVDTDSNGTLDAYRSILSMENRTSNIGLENGSYFIMNVDADLAERGATDIKTDWLNWTYEKNGEDIGRMIMNPNGEWPLYPTTSDNFYYTISKDQVVDWENVDATMIANDGAVSFGFQAPIAIPETTTMEALGVGAVALLAARRIKENAKRR